MAHKNLPIIDWSEIEASAPGKFIISGEYGVVYEKQAIATTIDLRTRVRIRPSKDKSKVRLNLKDLNDVREWPISAMSMCRLVSKYLEFLDYDPNMTSRLNSLMDKKYQVEVGSDLSEEKLKQANDATMAFLLLYISMGDSYANSARMPIEVEIRSQIPIGSGLGSSSALSVALGGALLRVFRVSTERYVVSKWAFNIDKFFHGQPSGVDNNIISGGGFLLFQAGKVKENRVKHSTPLKVLLIDTGVTRSTKDLIKKVNELMKQDPTGTEQLFTDMNAITSRIWREINKSDFIPSAISTDLQSNQELLVRLGVGHEKISDICTRADKFNLTAKQTGAGGGGSVFVLYNQDDFPVISQLKAELEEAGYKTHDHLVGCEGVVVQKKSITE